MKKLVALVVLSTTAVSFAAERKIYDIMYLPNQGTFYGFTTGSYDAANIYESDEKTDVNGYKFEQTLGYSINNNFSFNAAMNYLDYRTDIKTGENFNQSGLSDIDVNARYRIIEGDSDLDILAYGQIGLGDKVLEKDGDLDNKAGGHTVGLGAQWGQRKETFQWALLGRVDRILDATIDNEIVDEDQDVDSHNRYLLQGDILGKMTESVFFRGALSATVTDGFDVEDEAKASKNVYKISGELQHLTSENLLVRVGVANSHVETNSIDQYTIWSFIAGANYQF